VRRLSALLASLRRRLLPDGSLTQQAVSGAVWAAGSNVGERLLLLGRFVVLANVLKPSEFGLLGLSLLTVTVFKRLSELGIDAALVHKAEANVDAYLDTALVMRAVRGMAILCVGFLVAPHAAAFFDAPRATPVIRLLAVGPLLLGLQNPGIVYLQKDLEFHKQAVYRMAGAGADTAVALATALVVAPMVLGREPTVWALAYGVVAGNVTRFVVSYAVHDYRPSLGFDMSLARDLVSYGKWMTGSVALVFLINEGDDIVVGWALGTAALGFYQMAYRLSNAPATEITHVIGEVVFPTYAKLQDDVAALREGYFRTVQLTTFVAFPVAVGIAVVAPMFVRVVFGSAWTPAIDAMRLLAVFGLLRSLGATTGPLFQAVGRPDLGTKIQLGKLVVVGTLILPLTRTYGIEGTAVAVIASSLLFAEPVASYLAVRTVEGQFSTLGRILGYPAAAAGVMGVSVLALQSRLGDGVLQLTLLILTGVVVYALTVVLFETQFGYDMRAVADKLSSGLGG
jgi:O-antigen/teichoic acid export membrane protein